MPLAEISILTEFADLFLLRLPWLGIVWMTCLGACLGSFLNVVVYRLPAGLNIAYPPSRCPRCETPIRGCDNIPVFSWFLLKGRCRACGVPIAARYPKVEAFVAVEFSLMAGASVVSAQSNPDNLNEIALRLVYFGILQFALTGMFLIHFDRHAIPKSLTIFFAGCGVLIPIAAPSLVETWSSIGGNYFANVAGNLIGGILVGVSLGRLSARTTNLASIAVVAALFRGFDCVLLAGFLSILMGLPRKKNRWIFAFLFAALIGLEATYYILYDSSCVEIISKDINRTIRLVLTILFGVGCVLEVSRFRTKKET